MSSFNELSSLETGTEFSGVVHFMSDPELQDNCYSITLDLGSAPVDAFESVGAKSVEIGEFSVIAEG
jgi:hypothetical protein